MANFTVDITNATSLLGMTPPVVWNAFTWNGSLWGYTGDLPIDVDKGIDSSVASDTANGFDVEHGIDETTSPDSSVGFDASIGLENTVSPTSDPESEQLMNGGFYYVFPDRTVEGEERDVPSWSEGSVSQPTWTSAVVTTSTWS